MKAYYFDDYDKMCEVETKGQVVYLVEDFDAYTTTLSVRSVVLTPDIDFVTMTGGEHGQWQKPFVIDVPLCVNEDWTEIDFLPESKYMPPRMLNPGDKIYVYIGGDGDCYGDEILGVFSRKLKPEEIEKLKKYCEEKTWIQYVYEDMTVETILEP